MSNLPTTSKSNYESFSCTLFITSHDSVLLTSLSRLSKSPVGALFTVVPT